MSLNSVFIFIVCYTVKAILCWKPHQNWTRDITILVLLKTTKYKGNSMLLFALTKNQYQWVPTHFAWSHHKWFNQSIIHQNNRNQSPFFAPRSTSFLSNSEQYYHKVLPKFGYEEHWSMFGPNTNLKVCTYTRYIL